MPRTYRYVKSFHLNHEGIERIAIGPGCRVAVREIAEKAEAYAISISPDDDGVYKGSFAIKLHIRRDWPLRYILHRPRRVCADLINVHPAAIAIEKGSTHTRKDGTKYEIKGHLVLTRTLQHIAVSAKAPPRPRGRRGKST